MPTFYRLEKEGHGPYNHPDDHEARQICRNVRSGPSREAGMNLADLTDGQPNNWRSGCASLQDLVMYFAPVLPDLLARGFRVAAYPVPEDGLIEMQGESAAHTEFLIPSEAMDVTDTLLAWTLLWNWYDADQAFQAAEQGMRSNLERHTSSVWLRTQANQAAAEDAIRAIFKHLN